MFNEVYMVAIGDDYEKMAELTAPRVEHFLGIKPRVLLQEDCKAGVVNFDAYTAKMSLLEKGRMNGNQVLFIDCDAVVLNVFEESDFNPFKLNICRDRISQQWEGYQHIKEAMAPHPVEKTVNTGMFSFQRTGEFRTLFRVARRLRAQMDKSGHPYTMGDQLAFNIALVSMPWHKANVLPLTYNWQTRLEHMEPGYSRVVHFIGGTSADKLARVAALCERFPLCDA